VERMRQEGNKTRGILQDFNNEFMHTTFLSPTSGPTGFERAIRSEHNNVLPTLCVSRGLPIQSPLC
jgi:hypothetical protein